MLICGKFYHPTCVRSNSLTKPGNDSGTFICPRHVCNVCRSEGAKNGQSLRYCFDCCAAYHLSCQPDLAVLSDMYCVCVKCQRAKSVTPAPEQSAVTPVTASTTSSAEYNNPLDPRLASYNPQLAQSLAQLVSAPPIEPVAPPSPRDEGELSSGPALPTDTHELDRLAAMDEWDLYDLGYSEDQVKELKRRVTPPPSRGGFRGRGRGSFDASRDSFTGTRSKHSRERDDKSRDWRDSRSYRPRTPVRTRSPSPPRSKKSPLYSSHSRSDRRSPSPRSSHRYSRDRSPPLRDDKRHSPPSVPRPSSVQQTYSLAVTGPSLELTKYHKLICVLDTFTVSGPKLEMQVFASMHIIN